MPYHTFQQKLSTLSVNSRDNFNRAVGITLDVKHLYRLYG